MADTSVEDFPIATDVQARDSYLIQRFVSGVWTDFQVSYDDLLGEEVFYTEVDGNLNDLNGPFPTLVPLLPDLSGTQRAYGMVEAWIEYSPGATPITGDWTFSIITANGAQNYMDASLTLGSDKSAALFRGASTSFPLTGISTDLQMWSIGIPATLTTNGTFKVKMRYIIFNYLTA